MLKLIIFANFFLQFVIQINSKIFLYLCINFFKVQEDDITMITKLAVVFKYFILDILTESKFHNFKISGGFFFQSNNIKLSESGSSHLRSLSQDSIT